MKTVFVSGSRQLSHLNKRIRDRLQNVVDQHIAVVVGDANGADKAVQKYLSEIQYQNVVVFCSGESCRNNLGDWNTKHILVDPKIKGRDFYTQKDKKMAAVADYGFVLWDGKSPGSFNNVLELLKTKKNILVYVSPTEAFHSISNLNDARKLLEICDQESLNELNNKIQLNSTMREIEGMAQGSLGL